MQSANESVRQSCSHLARSHNEPLYATAPVAQSWILLEQPGAWGPDALTESSLDTGVAAELSRRTRPLDCRILLIRRRAGRWDNSPITCLLVNAQQTAPWMEMLTLTSPAQLLELPLEELLTSATPPGTGPAAREAFLICTHGRRDPCCAEYGRALMKDLVHEPNVWESSHLGGHRFAANMACFPHGLFYGKVEGLPSQRIVDQYRDGKLVLENYRGRSSDGAVVQAADYLVRTECGILEIHALTLGHCLIDGDSAQVEFTEGPNRYHVDLVRSLGEPRPESCNKPKLTIPEIWTLKELVVQTEGRL